MHNDSRSGWLRKSWPSPTNRPAPGARRSALISEPYDADADGQPVIDPLPSSIELRAFDEDDYELLPRLFALLEPALTASIVAERVALMHTEGWRCVGMQVDQKMVAMAGYSRRIHLFSGPILYVENVVVMPHWRVHGFGQALMQWIENHARETGCSKIALDAYAVNAPAQAFYKRLGYDPRGVHFVKEL